MNLDWTERALIDLKAIDDWLTAHADGDLSAAFLERIRERARRLRDFPRTGQQLNESARSVRVGQTPYVLLYRIRGMRIEILRVHHNRQDWRLDE